jgi:hypothetical protein
MRKCDPEKSEADELRVFPIVPGAQVKTCLDHFLWNLEGFNVDNQEDCFPASNG